MLMRSPRAASLLGLGVGLTSALAATTTSAAPTSSRPLPWTGTVGDVPARPLADAAPHAPSSRTIYLRRCPAEGCTVLPGQDDARTDHSSLAHSPTVIGPFGHSDALWGRILQCVKETYLPFDLDITDVDPGDAPHFECVVGGSPQDLSDHFDDTVGGVAPFTCAELPNAMTYVFDVWGDDVDYWCYAIAQETAHAFGLEHEMLNSDPLTYLMGPFPKRFQNQAASCGEYEDRACACGRPSQNSFQILLATFGARAPSPPTVAITAPRDGARVQPAFVVRGSYEDDLGIEHVDLLVDGQVVATTTQAPFVFNAPPSLTLGAHTVALRAFDLAGTPATAQVDVELVPPCEDGDGTCAVGEVCVAGNCEPGPDVAGGLGAACGGNDECFSGVCAMTSGGTSACVEECTTTRDDECPGGFTCRQAGGTVGVCWPDDEGGCCSTSGRGGAGALLLSTLTGLALLRRRRAGRR